LGWHPTEERHHLLQALAARQWVAVEAFGVSAIEPLLATLRVMDEPDAQMQAIALLVRFREARAVGPLVDLVGETERRSTQRSSPQQERASQEGNTRSEALQQAAIQAIEALLEQDAAAVPTEGLRKVGLLRDELSALPQYTPQEREAATRLLFGPESVPMPRMHVKHLAHLELQRRGLKA
jgi:hypothetical protein